MTASRWERMAADDDDVDHLLRHGRVRSRTHVARIRLGEALDSGFVVLPTFSRPHYTVVVERAPNASLGLLVRLALRDVSVNVYYRPWKER